jgi:hypothetical protein
MNVSQSFSIDPIQSNIKDSDMVLKFEILNVYKGSKYSDVLISEINFDGLDVLCLSKGTKISQPKGKAIRIEDILIGDTVITYNEKEDKISSVIVNKREKVNHTNLINYIFQNGDSIISTQDHPFLINDKGWCSLHPDKSSIYQGFEHIKKIEIGDSFNMIAQDGGHTLNKLIKIEYLKGIQETYTISKLSLGNNFIANGFIVGIEDLKCDK